MNGITLGTLSSAKLGLLCQRKWQFVTMAATLCQVMVFVSDAGQHHFIRLQTHQKLSELLYDFAILHYNTFR